MNTEDTTDAVDYSRLNDARAELRNRGFEAVRDAEGAWNIVMCACPVTVIIRYVPNSSGYQSALGGRTKMKRSVCAVSRLEAFLPPRTPGETVQRIQGGLLQ